MLRPAIFLDRDGTLIEETVGYLQRLDQLVLFPWTADALRLLARAGFATVVITNQSAVGRGIITEAFLDEVHAALDARLASGGARIERYYYCPHHPDATLERYRQSCDCRKPGSALITRACADLGLDPSRSWMVGDTWRDVQSGRAAGTRTILLRTGHGARGGRKPPDGVRADAILNNLMEAAAWILRTSTSR